MFLTRLLDAQAERCPPFRVFFALTFSDAFAANHPNVTVTALGGASAGRRFFADRADNVTLVLHGDLQPESLMTNATVAKLAAAPSGQSLTLKYKDGTQTINVKPGTPIVTFQPGTKADTLILLWMAGGMAQTETFDPKAFTPFEPGLPSNDPLREVQRASRQTQQPRIRARRPRHRQQQGLSAF